MDYLQEGIGLRAIRPARPAGRVPARGLRHVRPDDGGHQGGGGRLPVQPRGPGRGGSRRRRRPTSTRSSPPVRARTPGEVVVEHSAGRRRHEAGGVGPRSEPFRRRRRRARRAADRRGGEPVPSAAPAAFVQRASLDVESAAAVRRRPRPTPRRRRACCPRPSAGPSRPASCSTPRPTVDGAACTSRPVRCRDGGRASSRRQPPAASSPATRLRLRVGQEVQALPRGPAPRLRRTRSGAIRRARCSARRPLTPSSRSATAP